MRRSQTGSPTGSARSNPKLRRLIRYSQRPGFIPAQGGVLNPHKYPTYVIGEKAVLIPKTRIILEHEDLEDGPIEEQVITK